LKVWFKQCRKKRRSQIKCQENVKFALQLKESEVKIKDLEEELRNQKLLIQENRSKGLLVSSADCVSQKVSVAGFDSDKNRSRFKNDKGGSGFINSSNISNIDYNSIGCNTCDKMSRSTRVKFDEVSKKETDPIVTVSEDDFSECSTILGEEVDPSLGDCIKAGSDGMNEDFLEDMFANLNNLIFSDDEEWLSDYSESTFTEGGRIEYNDYLLEKEMEKEQGLSVSGSESSGSKIKIPDTSSILKYIFCGAPEKEKYQNKGWYGKAAVVRAIQAFAGRKYQLQGKNQNERGERLAGEMENLSKSVNKSVRFKELEPCF